ncbi:radical SAM protein [Clostridium carnis]
MKYVEPVYRPPSEAFGLIIQATLGCSHNKCAFCNMYKEKRFFIRNIEDVINDIRKSRKENLFVEKIFIADGDALIIKTENLKIILKEIKEIYPECKSVGIYGSPKSILLKSEKELKELYNLGLKIVYLGVESGSEEVLKLINKGVSQKEMIEAGLKIKKCGFKLSATLITGLGGTKYTNKHALESAKVINKIKPNDLAVLKVMIDENTKLGKMVKDEKFTELSLEESVNEIKLLVENLNVDEMVFRCNKLSNCINLSGVFNKEKLNFIKEINRVLDNEDFNEPIWENPKVPHGLGL